ncbi:hypothetical protein ACSBR1_014398 [Camellia fascicularis]
MNRIFFNKKNVLILELCVYVGHIPEGTAALPQHCNQPGGRSSPIMSVPFLSTSMRPSN